jgi:hypothetical protein
VPVHSGNCSYAHLEVYPQLSVSLRVVCLGHRLALVRSVATRAVVEPRQRGGPSGSALLE